MEFKTLRLRDISIGNKGYYGIGASAVEFSDELYRYLRITDINEDGTLNYKEMKSVKDKDAHKYLLKEGDIVFARTGNSTGKSYYYDKTIENLVYAGFLIRFSLDNNKINPKYLKYYTLTDQYKNWVKEIQTGSTRGNINAQTYGDLEIKVPNRDYQDKMVKLLSDIDRKIELNNKINDNLQNLAKQLYKRWFIDYEFPNKDGKPYKSSGGKIVNSELGIMPDNWNIKKFEEVFCFQEGPGIRNWQYVDKGGTKFVNIRCIKENDLDLSTANMISNLEANDKYLHFMLKEWDVIMSTSGTLGKSQIIRKDHLPLCLNTSVIRFTPIENFKYFSYMYEYLISDEFYEHLITKASGSVQANFGPTHLRQIKIKYPNNNILFEFNEIVFPLVEKIQANKKENNNLAKLRDTLLPKLMNGELDLAKIDI